MAQKNEKYLENFEQVKSDLKHVVESYLHKFFKDRFDQEKRVWKRDYQLTVGRFFSSHGKKGYSLALKTLMLFDYSQNIGQLFNHALEKTGSETLHRMISEHLLQNAVKYEEAEVRQRMLNHNARAMAGTLGAAGVTEGLAKEWAVQDLLCETLLPAKGKVPKKTI